MSTKVKCWSHEKGSIYNTHLFLLLFQPGGMGLATRRCLLIDDLVVVWDEPVYQNCGETDEEPALEDLPEVTLK